MTDAKYHEVEIERVRDVNGPLALEESALQAAWHAFQNMPIDFANDSDDEQCRAVGAAIKAYLAALPAPEGRTDEAVLQDDLRDMLIALGLPDGARPQSPHEVFRECIEAVNRLRDFPAPESSKWAAGYAAGKASLQGELIWLRDQVTSAAIAKS